MLDAVKSDWGIPPLERDETNIADLAMNPTYREEAETLLSEMRAAGKPWFGKDPLLSLLLPFWTKCWGEVVYIVLVHNHVDKDVVVPAIK